MRYFEHERTTECSTADRIADREGAAEGSQEVARAG